MPELTATASFLPRRSPRLTASVAVSPEPPTELLAVIEFDGTVAEMARPRTVAQHVGFRVTLDGQEIAVRPELEVTLFADALGTWHISTPLPSPLGAPATSLGAPPGLGSVGIDGVYWTETGRHLVPLIVNGIVHSESRSVSPRGERGPEAIATYQGVDRGGRYDQRLVTIDLPPGHGLSDGDVVNRLARLAGVTGGGATANRRLYKAVRAVNAPWLQLARDVMGVAGRAVRWDGSDFETPLLYDPSRRRDLTLTDTDLLASPLTTDATGKPLTRVTINGTAQVIRGDAGRRTEVGPPVRGYSVYAPVAATQMQSAVGSITSSGAAQESASLRLTSLVETVREFQGDALLSESIRTYGYYNPRSARYRQNTDGSRDYVKCYLGPEASADDESEGFAWIAERLVLIGNQQKLNRFDDEGYLTGFTIRRQVPRFRAAALKSRPITSNTFEETEFTADRLLLGNGSGIVELREPMPEPNLEIPTEIEEHVFRVDGGYILQEEVRRSEIFVGAGAKHLYAGGFVGIAETETLGLREVETTTYSDAAAGHGKTTVTVREGVTVARIEEGLQGSLPAAERFLDLIPSSGLYGEDVAAASRLESQEISGSWVEWALEGQHPRSESTSGNAWAETPAELRALAKRAVRESTAVPVSITLPANFYVRPCWRLGVALQGLDLFGLGSGFAADLWVKSVAWRLAGPDGPLLTTVNADYFPVTP